MVNPNPIVELIDGRARAMARGDWNALRECDITLARTYGIVIRDDEIEVAAAPDPAPEKRGPGRPRKEHTNG